MTTARSNFDFLRGASEAVYQAASCAEGFALSDPRASGFYARFALELATNRFIRKRKLQWMGNPLRLYDAIRLIEGAKIGKTDSAPILTFDKVRDDGNSAVHHLVPPFTREMARGCTKQLHESLTWIARNAPWPHQALAFDDTLFRDVPGHIATTLQDVQRLDADLAALRTAHEGLASEHAGLEAYALKLVGALDVAHRELTEAKAEIARLENEVDALQTTVGRSVPRADLDALRVVLAQTKAAYDELLAGRSLTSTRHMRQKGILAFDGLFVLAGDDERPDEGDEAASVILDELAIRHAALLSSLRPSA